MEVYFNVDVEEHWGSIILVVVLYILMAILLIEGILTFDFKIFVHSVLAL